MATTESVSIGAVLIQSVEPEKLADFYREAFGLGEPHREPDGHVGLRVANTYLGFDRVDEGGAAGRGSPERVTVWFSVPDCRAAFDRLVQLGARPRAEPDATCSPGETLATVADPEGNLVGLIGAA